MKTHCHKLVKETAIEMAQALYETLALDNTWYALNPDRGEFVTKVYPALIEQARSTLTDLLTSTCDERLKEEIADALIKDNTLRRGRQRHLH